MDVGNPPGVVVRETIHERLEGVDGDAVVEVLGPPGAGKTTAIRSWASVTDVGDVAWVAVERRHRDTELLAKDLLEAVAEALGHSAPAPSDAIPIDERLAELLVGSSRSVVIVVDGVETLEGASSLRLLSQLVAAASPAWRLVVVGRWIPDIGLEDLRRHGRLVTISGADLRLTDAEVDGVLRDVSGRRLDAPELARIRSVVDGWALGATLAGLALRNDREAFGRVEWQDIAGHRYFDLLFADVVFDSQPEDLREFLLDTSVLDVLDPDLCNELTGRTDSLAVLRGLERRQAFTEWIGGQPPAFRYHGLLRSWLRQRLDREQPGRAGDLGRRAARWCERQGRSAEAIEYWLEAGDVTAAESAITASGLQALSEGRYEAVMSWIEALPTETVTRSGPLLTLLVHAGYRLGRRETLVATLAIAERLLVRGGASDRPPSRFDLTVAAQRSRELQRDGRLADAADAAQQAAALVDFPGEPVRAAPVGFEDAVLAYEVSYLAAARLLVGDWDGCSRLSRWVLDTFPADDPMVAPPRISCLGKLALIELLHGARSTAGRLGFEAVALSSFFRLDTVDVGYAKAALVVADASIDRYRSLQELEQMAAQVGVASHTCLADLCRAWALVIDGDLAAAHEAWARARHIRASLAQPGMLLALERRVGAIVDTGVDEPRLTARELEVLAALAAGHSRREAAERLHLSLNTIKTYARRAFRALDVGSLAEAVDKCDALGIDLAEGRQSFAASGH